ncbi:hypothetical protein ALI22I_20485 [Saccharothrix sp. ALI-22-I]|uniref:hypothetical protein n=1 Tax=Saccharothrix sp. ALI-22-I TaxID=1933778 RepID=UPI00097BB7D2|nr:hypothetical protein [Saccharothrix sp. ALI-22-I]ONI88118.1 hypothetical protein ALI22I_20485 [Saccharothrix sp. ALI-22-I]
MNPSEHVRAEAASAHDDRATAPRNPFPSPCRGCGTDAGEPCRPDCTALDVVRPGRRDYRRIADGRYGLRGCFFCGGTGRDLFTRRDCACLFDLVGILDLAAEEMHERADDDDRTACRLRGAYPNLSDLAKGVARRSRRTAIRYTGMALLAALRTRGLAAEPHATKSGVAASVAITTPFGPVLVDVRHCDRGRVVVRRTDGTRWWLRTATGAHHVAERVHRFVPELAAEPGDMAHVVVVVRADGRDEVHRIDCSPRPEGSCRVCLPDRPGSRKRCPGPRAHLWQAAQRLRTADAGRLPGDTIIWGAFPVPAGAHADASPRRDLIGAARSLIERGELTIR